MVQGFGREPFRLVCSTQAGSQRQPGEHVEPSSQSGLPCQWMQLRQSPLECTAEVARLECWAPSGAYVDACQRAASTLAAQVHAHHRQPPWPAGCRQRAGAPVQARQAQPGVGKRHHLCSYTQWLALPGRGTGPVLQKGSGLGDGPEHASTTGVPGAAHGHCKPPSPAGLAGALRPRQPVRQPIAHGSAGKPWPSAQHEPQGQLLGQRSGGTILPESEDGASMAV